jgi:hypothetical protein
VANKETAGMKKLIAGLTITLTLISVAPCAKAADASAAAKTTDTSTAAIVSAILPGCGEWYNRGWTGPFPWMECVVGYVCFPFKFSSVLDAATGKADEGMRFDFWSAPAK